MMSASGQFPDLDALKREVRFTAVNGHRQLDKLFPQRATSRHGATQCGRHRPATEGKTANGI